MVTKPDIKRTKRMLKNKKRSQNGHNFYHNCLGTNLKNERCQRHIARGALLKERCYRSVATGALLWFSVCNFSPFKYLVWARGDRHIGCQRPLLCTRRSSNGRRSPERRTQIRWQIKIDDPIATKPSCIPPSFMNNKSGLQPAGISSSIDFNA